MHSPGIGYVLHKIHRYQCTNQSLLRLMQREDKEVPNLDPKNCVSQVLNLNSVRSVSPRLPVISLWKPQGQKQLGK